MDSSLDASAWAAVYELHASRLTRLASVLVGADAAHDLVADAVLRAVLSPGWSSVRDHGAYLSRTLVNLAASRHQARARREHRERVVVAAPVHRPLDPEASSEFRDVRAALDVLSPGERAVVFLHYWEDRTLADTARELGISPGSVRKQLHRAKRKLRDALDQEDPS